MTTTHTHRYLELPCPVCDGQGVQNIAQGLRPIWMMRPDDALWVECNGCDGTGVQVIEEDMS